MKKYLSYLFVSFAIGFAMTVGAFGTVVLATGCSRGAATDTGMAVSFDGSTGQVSIPVVTTATQNVTLELWVKLPEDAKGCFVKIGDPNTGYGIGVGATHTDFRASNAGNALIGLYEGSAWLYPTGNPTLLTSAWHHVAFVIGAASSAPTFYIDATPYSASQTAIPHAPANSADLGGDGIGGPRWSNATLAKVAVYNSALTEERVKAHASATSDAAYDAAVLDDKPVAFYALDEENGPSAADRSGNSNTGTYNGKVAFLQPGPFASRQQPASPVTTQPLEGTSKPKQQ